MTTETRGMKPDPPAQQEAALPKPTAVGDITHLLQAWSAGDRRAGEALVPKIYSEMRKIAAGNLALEHRNHTLQATDLVNEAFLRMLGGAKVSWQSRAHFFASAARVVRRLLVEHARRKNAARRGGGDRPRPLEEVTDLAAERPEELVALDDALHRLQEVDEDLAAVVEYGFFGGLTGTEIAEVLGVSTATVQRRSRLAKGWLYRHLSQKRENLGR